MEADIPLSTLPLQLEHAFVGCPLSFVRESLVPPWQALDTAIVTWGQTLVGCPRIFTNYTNFFLIRENLC